MTTDHASVIVVGGGIEGLCTAYSLARRGVRDVVVLERAELCGAGTGRSSGVVRCHYGVPSLAAMAWKGVQALERAAEELAVDDIGFVQCGYVVGVGAVDVAALEANVAMNRGLGIDVELVDRAVVAQWWPHTYLDDMAAFAYEPRGGYGDAYQTGQAFAAAARRHGATIRQHTEVAGITVDRGGRSTGVALTDGTSLGADAVVVTAGPWSTGLVEPVGVDLPVRAQRVQIVLVRPDVPIHDVPVFSDLVSLQYVRRERSGDLLVGNSDHSEREFVDPDAYVERADERYLDVVAARMAHRFPGIADPALAGSYAGCYDVTPDFNPVISATPVDGLFVGAGFSGHGYKIAPAVGDLLADLVLYGDSTDPGVAAADFRLGRFAEDAPLVSRHRYMGAGQMR